MSSEQVSGNDERTMYISSFSPSSDPMKLVTLNTH